MLVDCLVLGLSGVMLRRLLVDGLLLLDILLGGDWQELAGEGDLVLNRMGELSAAGLFLAEFLLSPVSPLVTWA